MSVTEWTPRAGDNREVDPKRCRASVWAPIGGWGHHNQCSRAAKVDGKWCKQHSPEYVAAKKAKADAEYQAQREAWAAEAAHKEHTAACARALAGIEDPEGAVAGLVETLARFRDDHDAEARTAGRRACSCDACSDAQMVLAPFLAAREQEAKP